MKKYEMPEIKVSAFDAEDIITASGLTNGGAEYPVAAGENVSLYVAKAGTSGDNEVSIVNPFN